MTVYTELIFWLRQAMKISWLGLPLCWCRKIHLIHLIRILIHQIRFAIYLDIQWLNRTVRVGVILLSRILILLLLLLIGSKIGLALFNVNSSLSGWPVLLIFYLELNLLVCVPPHVTGIAWEALNKIRINTILHGNMAFVLIGHHIIISLLDFLTQLIIVLHVLNLLRTHRRVLVLLLIVKIKFIKLLSFGVPNSGHFLVNVWWKTSCLDLIL